MAAGVLQVAWQRYLFQLNKRPLRTKALTSALVAGLSDVLAQRILGGPKRPRNWKRTLLMFIYGLLWNGPSAHFWQKFMEVVFRGKSDLRTVLKKVLLDQLTYGPVCNLMFMSYATLALEGRSLRFLSAKVANDYPRVQLSGWKLWPAAALINYSFVPLKFRVLFVNFVALFWSVFLLLSARGGTPGRAPAAAEKDE